MRTPSIDAQRFKAPKRDRTIPNHVNHALTDDGTGFAPKADTNRSWRDIVNSNKPKQEEAAPATVHDNFEVKAETIQGRTHSATEQARRIICTVPGTHVVDWEATYNARLRFVSKQQAAFVRR